MDAVLPPDLAEAHALIERLTASLAEKDAALSHRDDEIERLERILDNYIRRQYGRRSEQLPPEQMAPWPGGSRDGNCRGKSQGGEPGRDTCQTPWGQARRSAGSSAAH